MGVFITHIPFQSVLTVNQLNYWAQLSEGCSQELQRLQNQAARLVLKRWSSVDPFRFLNWISLQRRRDCMNACLYFSL
jgi:hypothetical protein